MQTCSLTISISEPDRTGSGACAPGLKQPNSYNLPTMDYLRAAHTTRTLSVLASLCHILLKTVSRLIWDKWLFYFSFLRLWHCNLSWISCAALASALRSNRSSHLTELDLSHNDLQDSRVKLLCDLMESPHYGLKTLRSDSIQLRPISCKIWGHRREVILLSQSGAACDHLGCKAVLQLIAWQNVPGQRTS